MHGTSEHNNQKNNIGKKIVSPSKDDASTICLSSSPDNIMHRGYFPVWRKITEWGWYKEPYTKAVFLHLLLTANHKDTDFLGHSIKEGQCVHGIIELSKAVGMSYQSTRTSLKHLEKTKEITIQPTNRFTIYTLTNYFKYTPENYRANKPLTINQQSTNKPLTTSNNVKNDNNEKNIHPLLLKPEFKEAWEAWLEVRKTLKAPNTERALTIHLNNLSKYNLRTAIAMLDQSTSRGWKGIFELKTPLAPEPQHKTVKRELDRPPTDEEAEILRKAIEGRGV